MDKPNSLFQLHPQLAQDGLEVIDLPLCKVLLMNNARYPWFILVPRIADISEIHQLDAPEREQLWRESDSLSRLLVHELHADKLNIAALGNVVPQLHVHHIVRYRRDDAWPAPVWGKYPAIPYDATQAKALVSKWRSLLNRAISEED